MIWIVNAAHFDGYAKTSFAEGSACPYTGKTAEQFAAEGYDVLNDEQFDELLERYQTGLCGRWKEVTEEEYNEQLNVLPPIGWNGSGFWMSEYTYGDVTAYYQRFGGRYYTSLQRINTSRKEILASLDEYVEAHRHYYVKAPVSGWAEVDKASFERFCKRILLHSTPIGMTQEELLDKVTRIEVKTDDGRPEGVKTHA